MLDNRHLMRRMPLDATAPPVRREKKTIPDVDRAKTTTSVWTPYQFESTFSAASCHQGAFLPTRLSLPCRWASGQHLGWGVVHFVHPFIRSMLSLVVMLYCTAPQPNSPHLRAAIRLRLVRKSTRLQPRPVKSSPLSFS